MHVLPGEKRTCHSDVICKYQVNSNPENPWSLILAHDEITPGNLLRPDNTRKFTAFYISFLEFGHQALRHEQCWFLVGIIRTKTVQNVVGGFSCVAKKLLRALLVDRGSFTHGIILPLDAGPTMLFARLGVHLGDEAALSSCLGCKGASGIKPCLKCANVVKRDSGLAARSHRVVEVTCFEPQRFVRTNDDYVWSMHDRLAGMQGNVTVVEFEKHQRAYGLTLNNEGVVADRDLRAHVLPVTSMCFDWQHTFLANGVASQEIHCFLQACKTQGCREVWALLADFCRANWNFTRHHHARGVAIHQIFNKSREKASGDHWKSSASELLTAYPLVRRFAESIIAVRFPDLQRTCQSFLACCKVLDMLQDIKAQDEILDTAPLQQAVKDYLQLHCAVYGEDGVKPKHHYALHVPEQAQQYKILLDCFVVERSHQLPKLMATPVKNTASFEKSVVARSLLVRLRNLEDFHIENGLRGRLEAFPELAAALGKGDVLIAAEAMLAGVSLFSRDMVRMGKYVLSFRAAISCAEDVGILGHLGDVVEQLSATAKVYKMQPSMSLLWVEGLPICPCHAWSTLASGHVLALLPDIA